MKNKHPIVKFYRFFKSVKLALALIGYLVVTSIIASLIPQGREMGFYAHEFSAPIYKLIITLNLNNFFRSILFLLPLGVFTINLVVCTTDRLLTRIRNHAPLRLGPDIIHIGLLVLIIAGLITLFQRREGFVFLSPGDSVELPNGYELTLKEFVFEVYPDQRPKRWISKVEIVKRKPQEKNQNTSHEPRMAIIEVNRPLTLGGLNIFQYSYKDISTLTLKNTSGSYITIHTGNGLWIRNSFYRFARVATDLSGLTTVVRPKKPTKEVKHSENPMTEKLYAIFIEVRKGEKDQSLKKSSENLPEKQLSKAIPSRFQENNREFKSLQVGSKLGEYTITKITPRLESGLNVVYDPGFIPIIIGLLLVGFGLTLTLIQKIGDKKL